MKIELKILVEVKYLDPELIDKILGRIYTIEPVEDVRLIEETVKEA